MPGAAMKVLPALLALPVWLAAALAHVMPPPQRDLWLLLALAVAFLALVAAWSVLHGLISLPLPLALAAAAWFLPLPLAAMALLGGWLTLAVLVLSRRRGCDGGWWPQLACRLAVWLAPALLVALVAALPR